ncbi:hypothetical protein J2T08_003387 [Neorhizobium galegae]|uniref:DUF4087 domain-containing protein n=1 Tax=Neorhizobium galegae TaxID=399 RepID=UPI00278725EE|nr:DUF4087 domain-containing protein [Neorhizobium galegae]MDQ0135466.1 hypothetical protein [Neorhizobium galegae]
MKRIYGTVAALAFLALPAFAHAAENRCGWIQNPTPGNWWLDDAEGTWVIRSQGSEDEPKGMDLIPDISERDYVRTNGNYGYACGCMRVETDDVHIVEILSFRQVKLSQCRSDRTLGSPG